MAQNQTKQPATTDTACELNLMRQRKEFSIQNYLANAEMSLECNCDSIDGIIGNNDSKDDTDKKKSLTEQLAQCKTQSDHNAKSEDGYKPERGR